MCQGSDICSLQYPDLVLYIIQFTRFIQYHYFIDNLSNIYPVYLCTCLDFFYDTVRWQFAVLLQCCCEMVLQKCSTVILQSVILCSHVYCIAALVQECAAGLVPCSTSQYYHALLQHYFAQICSTPPHCSTQRHSPAVLSFISQRSGLCPSGKPFISLIRIIYCQTFVLTPLNQRYVAL